MVGAVFLREGVGFFGVCVRRKEIWLQFQKQFKKYGYHNYAPVLKKNNNNKRPFTLFGL